MSYGHEIWRTAAAKVNVHPHSPAPFLEIKPFVIGIQCYPEQVVSRLGHLRYKQVERPISNICMIEEAADVIA